MIIDHSITRQPACAPLSTPYSTQDKIYKEVKRQKDNLRMALLRRPLQFLGQRVLSRFHYRELSVSGKCSNRGEGWSPTKAAIQARRVFVDAPKSFSTLAKPADDTVKVESLTTHENGKICYIKWNDGFQSEFHCTWLRHNCHCSLCRHENGQRLYDASEISPSLFIKSIRIEDDDLKVTWSGPDVSHDGVIPLSFLREHNYNPETIQARRDAVRCDRSVSSIPTMHFNDIMTSKEGLLTWLQQINEAGVSIIKDVPPEDSMVEMVGEKVSPILHTIYGKTFDVVVTPDPINVAYSEAHIDLHMDLVYFESPPGLQLLHCLSFDECVEGGESVFLDAFTIADEFRVSHPDLFRTLASVPATFEKIHYNRDYPVHILTQKPHIKLNHLDEVVAVYWAPPFEGALSVKGEDVEKYYAAYEAFAKSMKSSPHLLKHKLMPGELVTFNNLRMLHGRGSFSSNGGHRHLRGCYLNIDNVKSATQVLSNLVGDGRLAKRVGNQCWF